MPHPDHHDIHAGIAQRIVRRLIEEAAEAHVTDVRIGLGYTAVMLADGRTGVAYTFRDLAHGGCSVFNGIRPLPGRPAADLLTLLTSPDAIEAAVGLACANALANVPDAAYLDGDILDLLDLRPSDDVGMIGNFGPLVGPIRARARSLTVIERESHPVGLLPPPVNADAALPRCQVALITATSVINHTVDGLLGAAMNCREVVLLGASTHLVADVFRRVKVTLLSGVVVTDPEAVLRVVSEGGGMRQFSPYVRKVTRRVDGSQTIPNDRDAGD
jgi:uncharacterized protein (DUF4213/DUF364 family)